RFAEVRRARTAHHRAAPRAGLDREYTTRLEQAQGLAQGGAAHSEALDHVPLGRQHRAGSKLVVHDVARDVTGDPLGRLWLATAQVGSWAQSKYLAAVGRLRFARRG